MTQKIFILSGKSGSGKDTGAKLLSLTEKKLTNIKFSSPMKRMFEYAYSLPSGALENRELRSLKPSDCDDSYLELMVKAFTHFRAIDPQMMIRKVMFDAKVALASGKSLVFTDMRCPEEAKAVEKLLAGRDFEVVLVLLERDGLENLESDIYLSTNRTMLSRWVDRVVEVRNNGTIEQLAETFYQKIYGN